MHIEMWKKSSITEGVRLQEFNVQHQTFPLRSSTPSTTATTCRALHSTCTSLCLAPLSRNRLGQPSEKRVGLLESNNLEAVDVQIWSLFARLWCRTRSPTLSGSLHRHCLALARCGCPRAEKMHQPNIVYRLKREIQNISQPRSGQLEKFFAKRWFTAF